MEITEEQRLGILAKVEVESSPLLKLLLQDHLFPWIRAHEETEVNSSDPAETRAELKELALDFFIASVKEQIPDASTERILSRMEPANLASAVMLVGEALAVVNQYLKLDNEFSLYAAQEAANLDEELNRLLSEG